MNPVPDPVNPAEGVYVIGTPQVDRAVIELAGGKTFEIRASKLSADNKYIQGATLNDKPIDRCWIRHEEIAAGGTLHFTMGPEPNTGWASSPGRLRSDVHSPVSSSPRPDG